MKQNKYRLISLAKKVIRNKRLTPNDIQYLLAFDKKADDSLLVSVAKQLALPLSLAFGFFYTIFPDEFAVVANHMPSWTNFSPRLLNGVDYLWDILAEPVGKANILYHLPNFILYSFGIFGVKKLFDAIDKHNWVDKILIAQNTLRKNIASGQLNLGMEAGHSLLFVGKGDFIGMQFALDHQADQAVTISEVKPTFTQIWNAYNSDTVYEDLKDVIDRSDGESSGEYIFFPVKDDQIFLPSETAYDLSPHKLDILCQNIRTIEKESGWDTKRIIIVGDRFHKSRVVSVDRKVTLPKSEDIISLGSIAKKYPNVTLLDPTDIVLKEIIRIAAGRKIIFRATKEGISEYKNRFYNRLEKLGYQPKAGKKGVLTIGYDIFEDQTEQQMLSRKIDDYYPVVLSKTVHDALIRRGNQKSEFIYVPDLVLQTISSTAEQQ